MWFFGNMIPLPFLFLLKLHNHFVRAAKKKKENREEKKNAKCTLPLIVSKKTQLYVPTCLAGCKHITLTKVPFAALLSTFSFTSFAFLHRFFVPISRSFNASACDIP